MALALALVGVSASNAGRAPSTPRDAVLYTIGITTNPYGRSRPIGFGVITGVASGTLHRVEIRNGRYGWFPGADWLDRGRILVHPHAPPLRSPLVFAYRKGRLVRVRVTPIPGGSVYQWSRDWRRVAFEPPIPCKPGQASLFSCYRAGRRIFVANADGSAMKRVATGVLAGWTARGRLVVYGSDKAWRRGDAIFIDTASGKKQLIRRFWFDRQPMRSADGRYLARIRGAKNRTDVIVSRPGGAVVQTLSTHYALSMVAWSTQGHLLAYTTSGFPSPHQLFVVDPGHEPRKIFATGPRHFDWVTWSPDGRRLLLDGDASGGWRVFSARTGRQLRRLPRLGGRPLWCCPVNEYRGNGR